MIILKMDAIHENAPDSGLRPRGRRAALLVLVASASATLFLLAFTGFGWNSRPDGNNGPASSIGKSGEMKSPGGTSFIAYGQGRQ
jgi:hypothetical protein